MEFRVLTPSRDGRSTTAIVDGLRLLGHDAYWTDPKIYGLVDYCSRADGVFVTKNTSTEILRHVNSPTILWYPDVRDFAVYERTNMVDVVEEVDYMLVKTTRYIDKWRSYNRNTHYFKQSVSPEVYSPPDEITPSDHSKFDCDVVFCGTTDQHYHGERREWVDTLRDADFDFKLWCGDGNERVEDPDQYAKMVKCSKINIGMSARLPESEGYLSARAYMVWACGGFFLARRCKNFYNYFPENICDTWVDTDELVDKCHYWINHPEERKQIAENAREWFLEEGSSKSVMERILDIVYG